MTSDSPNQGPHNATDNEAVRERENTDTETIMLLIKSIETRLSTLEDRPRSTWDWIRDVITPPATLVAIILAGWTFFYGQQGFLEVRKPPVVAITSVALYRNYTRVPMARQTFDATYGHGIDLEVRADDEYGNHYRSDELECEWYIAPQQPGTSERNAHLLNNNDCTVYYIPSLTCAPERECVQTVVVEITGFRGRESEVGPYGLTSITFNVNQ
jgi:hypothetical protein